MSTVTLNGVRVNDADVNNLWDNFGSGGPSPAAEPQLKYQGSFAVNKKVTSTTSRTGVELNDTTSYDMVSTYPLWLAKVKVADAGDLNTTYGVELSIGSANNQYYSYNVAGSGANNDQYTSGYNSQGGLAEGYIITAVNPNVSEWREATTGSPVLSSTDWYAVSAQFVVGGAKSENVAMDAVDIGTGLDYTGPSFTFEDGVTTDQQNVSNRWGFACANGTDYSFRGLHRVGAGGVSTTGTDTSSVRFPDGYHGTGDAGILVDLTNASTSIALNGSYAGLGRVYTTEDTRPDLTVSGTLGSLSIGGTFTNFNELTLTSQVNISGATLQAQTIVQSSATISNSTIQTDSVSTAATMSSPNLGNLSDITFVQTNSGHAIEITATGTYTFTNLNFNGYGVDGANDAAVVNSSGGLVTINVSGGDTPTIRNIGGATTNVVSAVTITLTGMKDGTEVRIFDGGTSTELDGIELVTAGTTDNRSFSFGATPSDVLDIKFANNDWITDSIIGYVVPSSNSSIPVSQRQDRVFDNPL